MGSRQDESAAALGARWITAAFMAVGILNYAYALLLTRLLDVQAYSRFAAGQGLILWVSTVATVSVPWVLAQALARSCSDEERSAATRFAMLTSVVSGLIAAVVVGSIAVGFASKPTALVLAASSLIIFLGTTATGWLQGQEQMKTLSILYVSENILKIGSGALLVAVAGLGDAGALAAFGLGGLAMLVRWPRVPRSSERPWLGAMANHDLWRSTFRIAGVQGVVSLLTAIDVVLIAILPGSRALVASYQASVTLSRVPLFIAGAVATAFFPLLSRSEQPRLLAARAVRMYSAVALPIAGILMTMPSALLSLMFPSQYGPVSSLLRYTAVSGLAAGGISLVTAFFQAANDYGCLKWLGLGALGYVGALLIGWRANGVVGFAVGACVGGAVTLCLLGTRLVRQQGLAVVGQVPFLEPLVAIIALFLLRGYPMLWLAAAVVVGLRTKGHFLRPGARHRRTSRLASFGRRGLNDQTTPAALLADSVWRRRVRPVHRQELNRALDMARRNGVEGRLACVYADQLPEVLMEVDNSYAQFEHALEFTARCFNSAAIIAIFPEARLPSDHVCEAIDFMILARDWHRALHALSNRYLPGSGSLHVSPPTAYLCSSDGPVLRLHTTGSWFGVPRLDAETLLKGAYRSNLGFLIPGPSEYLRILLARAVFRKMSLSMSDLLTLRKLLQTHILTQARAAAWSEGWNDGFETALSAACAAIQRLDRGDPVELPIQLAAIPLQRRSMMDTYPSGEGRAVGARDNRCKQPRTTLGSGR